MQCWTKVEEKKMKNYIYIILVALTLIGVGCTNDDASLVELGSDISTIEIGATGGTKKVRISASDEWVSWVQPNTDGTANPWIAISPANGRGSATCDFIIDSALTTKPREAVVTIENIATKKRQRITIKQEGYKYSTTVDEPIVNLKRFDDYNKRFFEVVVSSNYQFKVEIPDSEKKWLEVENFELKLDRGTRPRDVKIRFNWKVNNQAIVRKADIKFVPVENIEVASSQILSVTQEAAEPIIENTRSGDSLSLLNIASSMQCWSQYDTSVPMDRWGGVTLWEDNMDGCTPENLGRVRKVEIFLCNSYEGLPYEIQYLTAADEIYIFSNENSMLKSLNLGEHILKLQNLKRLTVGAFGLSELPENFKFDNLEYLDLGSNNFQSIPSVINHYNLPKLRALVLNAQQRHAVSDLKNTIHSKESLGGLIEEEKFPEDLLLWGENKEGLDTLVLSVNYLQGKLPSFDGRSDVPRWEQADIDNAKSANKGIDSLPQVLVDDRIPKIMPNTKTFRINHNRLSGELPKWLLMHPALDWWLPFSLVFPQEGRDLNGTKAGFSNEPPSLLQYYTEWYPNKTLASSLEEDTTPIE